MLQADTNVTMSAPDIPPPTPAEARKALDAAFAEIGIVFKKKPIVIKEYGNKILVCRPLGPTSLGPWIPDRAVCYHRISLSSI